MFLLTQAGDSFEPPAFSPSLIEPPPHPKFFHPQLNPHKISRPQMKEKFSPCQIFNNVIY